MSGSSSSPPAGPAAADQPLGLTVHSLPSHTSGEAVQQVRTRSGRWKMLGVMLVCAAPVIASYFTYYVVRPAGGTRAFGTLIEPQRPLPDAVVRSLDNQPVRLTSLKGQWLLVSVAPSACDEACVQNLYWQRQLRESLGKEKERVDRVWLVTDDGLVPEKLRAALDQFTVLRLPAAQAAAWLAPAEGQRLTDHLYLVDPMGHWMMRFPPALDLASAGKAKRDLDRLLRASSSWDLPGRQP